MFQITGRFNNPCILIYHYNEEIYPYNYGKDDGDEIRKFILPRNISNRVVDDICHQCPMSDTFR